MAILARAFPWALCAVLLLVLARQRTAPSPELARPWADLGAVGGREVRDRKHAHKTHIVFTPEEWKEASDLLAKECPHRFRRIDNLEKRLKEGKKVEGNLRSQKAFIESPALYPLRLREVHLEDEIYGVCVEHPRGDKQMLRSRLKPIMLELVKIGFQVRKGRISLVESAVAEQKKLLDTDEQNIDKAVDRRVEETIATAIVPKSKTEATTDPSSEE